MQPNPVSFKAKPEWKILDGVFKEFNGDKQRVDKF